MSTDIICFVPDSKALITELREKCPKLVSEEGEFSVNKTPSVKNSKGESLTLVRMGIDLITSLEQLESLIMLGTYEDVFNTPNLLSIYDSVYDRTPMKFIDEESKETITITPPERFGEIA